MINEVFRVVPNPACLVVVEDDELGFAHKLKRFETPQENCRFADESTRISDCNVCTLTTGWTCYLEPDSLNGTLVGF
jgi:hypothetical protein